MFRRLISVEDRNDVCYCLQILEIVVDVLSFNMSSNAIHSAEEFVAKSYHIVIVGGGTAGLTLATRYVGYRETDIGNAIPTYYL